MRRLGYDIAVVSNSGSGVQQPAGALQRGATLMILHNLTYPPTDLVRADLGLNHSVAQA
jgi:hypothetical protein